MIIGVRTCVWVYVGTVVGHWMIVCSTDRVCAFVHSPFQWFAWDTGVDQFRDPWYRSCTFTHPKQKRASPAYVYATLKSSSTIVFDSGSYFSTFIERKANLTIFPHSRIAFLFDMHLILPDQVRPVNCWYLIGIIVTWYWLRMVLGQYLVL